MSIRIRRRSRSGRARRGQGLVEFALIAPVVLLLLLMTIDFGRALYGWVVLQNSARIAANFAGVNPTAWRDNIAATKARYATQITTDLQAANCDSFGSGAATGPVPSPTFVDGPDNAVVGGPPDTIYDVGDIARVSLTCTFHPMTPIISAIVGNNFVLGATSEFRIRTGIVTGQANASPITIPPPAPSSSASASASASAPASCSPTTLSFTATDRSTRGNPHRMDLAGTAAPVITGLAWTWSELGAPFANTQNVNNYDFASTGAHNVTLTATKTGCTYSVTQTVNVP